MENKKQFNFGRIYNEVADGCSEKIINKYRVYFKHPTVSENFTIYARYDNILAEAKLKGLLTQEEKINEAIEGGWWTKDREREIYILRKSVANLIKTRSKLIIPSQKNAINTQIKRNESILLTLIKERQEFLNYTAEEYVNSRFVDEMIIYYSYKDKSLKEKLFDNLDDYFDIADEISEKIRTVYNTYDTELGDKNVRMVAASGFFQNMIYLGDTCVDFWGQPVNKCSKYQIDLLVYGKIYKNVIKNRSENGEPIRDEILNDPELFLNWLDDESNKSKTATPNSNSKYNFNKGDNAVSSYVGASADDLEKMGVKVEKIKGKSLLDLAREKGGTLEKSDYLKVRENL